MYFLFIIIIIYNIINWGRGSEPSRAPRSDHSIGVGCEQNGKLHNKISGSEGKM